MLEPRLLFSNHAPVLDNNGVPSLWIITGNGIANSGTTVSAIIASAGGDRITDADAGALEGIAVVATDITHGAWQYSLDSGGTWITFKGYYTAARLLAADASTRVRFLPSAGFSGTIPSAITFKAWDRTSGSNGGAISVLASQWTGTSTFSSATETAGITVSPQSNHAPVLDNRGKPKVSDVVVGQPNTGTKVSDLIASAGGDSIKDADAGALEGIAVVATDTTCGAWQYSLNSGSTWTTFKGYYTVARLLAADADTRIRFVPDTGFSGTINPAINFRGWDQTGGQNGDTINAMFTGGSASISVATENASLAVIPANHAPVLDCTGIMSLAAVDEDAATNTGTLISDLLASAGGDRITDADVGDKEGIAVVAADATNGTWQYTINDGAAWTTFTPSYAAARLLAADTHTKIRYVPDANYNGTLTCGITFRAWDQTTGSNGSTGDALDCKGGIAAFSTAIATASLAVVPVNDAPVLDNGGDMKLHDISVNDYNNAGTLISDLIASAGGDRITDADDDAKEGIAVVATDTTHGSWQYTTDGTTWTTLDGDSTAARLLSADANTRIRLIPNTGYAGTIASGITFKAWDGTSGDNGGAMNVTSALWTDTSAYSDATETASIAIPGLEALGTTGETPIPVQFDRHSTVMDQNAITYAEDEPVLLSLPMAFAPEWQDAGTFCPVGVYADKLIGLDIGSGQLWSLPKGGGTWSHYGEAHPGIINAYVVSNGDVVGVDQPKDTSLPCKFWLLDCTTGTWGKIWDVTTGKPGETQMAFAVQGTGDGTPNNVRAAPFPSYFVAEGRPGTLIFWTYNNTTTNSYNVDGATTGVKQLWRSDDFGKTARIVTVATPSFRHWHVVQYEPKSERWFAFGGDATSEASKVWPITYISDDDGLTWTNAANVLPAWHGESVGIQPLGVSAVDGKLLLGDDWMAGLLTMDPITGELQGLSDAAPPLDHVNYTQIFSMRYDPAADILYASVVQNSAKEFALVGVIHPTSSARQTVVLDRFESGAAVIRHMYVFDGMLYCWFADGHCQALPSAPLGTATAVTVAPAVTNVLDNGGSDQPVSGVWWFGEGADSRNLWTVKDTVDATPPDALPGSTQVIQLTMAGMGDRSVSLPAVQVAAGDVLSGEIWMRCAPGMQFGTVSLGWNPSADLRTYRLTSDWRRYAWPTSTFATTCEVTPILSFTLYTADGMLAGDSVLLDRAMIQRNGVPYVPQPSGAETSPDQLCMETYAHNEWTLTGTIWPTKGYWDYDGMAAGTKLLPLTVTVGGVTAEFYVDPGDGDNWNLAVGEDPAVSLSIANGAGNSTWMPGSCIHFAIRQFADGSQKLSIINGSQARHSAATAGTYTLQDGPMTIAAGGAGGLNTLPCSLGNLQFLDNVALSDEETEAMMNTPQG